MRFALVAWGLLAAAAAAAQPYRRTRVPETEVCLSWPNRTITYQVDAAGSSRTPRDSEFQAIDAAFRTWQQLSDSCSDFRLIAGPRLAELVVGGAPGSEGVNAITFREVSCQVAVPAGDPCLAASTCQNEYRCWDHPEEVIALTTVTYKKRSGQIQDADIELQAAPHADGEAFLFTTVNAPPCSADSVSVSCVAMDVQNTMTHEIGHLLGFDHVPGLGSTMEASALVGETNKRIIDSGTAQGFCDTYPRALAPVPCDQQAQLRRRIVARSTGTPGLESVGCSALTGLEGEALFLAGCLLARRRRRS